MNRISGLHTKEVTMSSNEMETTHGGKQSTFPTECMYLACFSKDRNESARLWTWIALLSVHLIFTIGYLSMLYVSHCDIEIPCVGTLTEVEYV